MDENKENLMRYLVSKLFTCPVCGLDFTDYMVRPSKMRVVSMDTDLRTVYHAVDPNCYEVILCVHCGYAALRNQFGRISEKQANIVMKTILPGFKSKIFPVPLSLEHAVERYKMALLCASAKGAKSGEKAFLYLKTAWLFRAMEDKDNEILFLSDACKLFKEAYFAESSPIGPFDDNTVQLLIAELSRRTGDFAEAAIWVSRILLNRKVATVIRRRSETIRDLIREGVTQ